MPHEPPKKETKPRNPPKESSAGRLTNIIRDHGGVPDRMRAAFRDAVGLGEDGGGYFREAEALWLVVANLLETDECARADGAKAEAEVLSRALALADCHLRELEADRAPLAERTARAEARALEASAELEAVLFRAENVLKIQLRGWVPGPDRDRFWNYVRGVHAEPVDGLVEAILDAAPGAPSERLAEIFGCSYCGDERCKFGQEVCERAKAEYAEARRRGMPESGRKA